MIALSIFTRSMVELTSEDSAWSSKITFRLP